MISRPTLSCIHCLELVHAEWMLWHHFRMSFLPCHVTAFGLRSWRHSYPRDPCNCWNTHGKIFGLPFLITEDIKIYLFWPSNWRRFHIYWFTKINKIHQNSNANTRRQILEAIDTQYILAGPWLQQSSLKSLKWKLLLLQAALNVSRT